LAQAADISVTKDSPEPLDKAMSLAIALDVLVCDEADKGLAGGKTGYAIHSMTSLGKSMMRRGSEK
jgi:hypothetical protein